MNSTIYPIRILHVLTAMNMAGTETLLMSYYKNIDRHKVQFDFAVSAAYECAYDNEIIKMGGLIHHYPRYKGYNHYTYVKWWKKFFENHPEYLIVHGHIGSTAAIYLKIAKQYGRYAIAHSHGTWGEKNLHAILYRFFSYPTRYIADYFFACSKQALIDRYGVKVSSNSEISSVMTNAIDAQKFVYNEQYRNEIRKEYGIADDEFVIGTVGRLTPQKNPFFTVCICEELARRGVKFKFLWFGQGELEADIQKEIAKLNLDDYIIMAGVRKDIFKVMQAMDVFVFPSVWEGLGISCIEAQAAGLPTICSNKVPEDANITEKFLYLPLGNASLWASKIVEQKTNNRENMFDIIEESGYNIPSAAFRLQNYYIDVYLKRFN